MKMYPATYHGCPSFAFSSVVAISGVIELETMPDTCYTVEMPVYRTRVSNSSQNSAASGP
jgi:hypothetical protein